MIRASVMIGRASMSRYDTAAFIALTRSTPALMSSTWNQSRNRLPGGMSLGIPDGATMMLCFPAMKLKDEFVALFQSFIVRAAVRALTIEQPLIPTATRFDIADAYKWLQSQ